MEENIKGTNEIEEKDTKNLSEKEYRKLKLKLEEMQKRGKRKFPLIIALLSSVLFSFLFYLVICDIYDYRNTISGIVFAIILGITSGVVMMLYCIMVFEMQESKIRQRMLDYEAENIKEEVKEDVFENSIKMSYKYLDQYYLQTREQAQKGFFITVCVSVFGAILIGVGIVAMFLGKTEPTFITCASGVITEFIAAIFFYLYNKTVASMSKYHNKLVLSQNISIALKVSDSLPSDDKIKAKNMIITELLKDINSYLIKSDSEDNKAE